jgi:hypothetical protein
MSLRWSSLALLALCTAAGSAAAQPKPKPASACGQRLLPLTVGNQWVFEQGRPPTPPPDDRVKTSPVQPKKLTITVVAIETVGGKSVVKLEEDVDGMKAQTTITCGGGSFEPSPDSVFFAGEPGGVLNLTWDKLEQRLVTGKPFTAAWRQDLIATWKQVPAEGTTAELGTGKLEIEREFVLASGTEAIGTPYTAANPKKANARKLGVTVTGRVTLDRVGKPNEMPANWTNYIWFVDGVGPVQILNNYFHLYMLAEATIVK